VRNLQGFGLLPVPLRLQEVGDASSPEDHPKEGQAMKGAQGAVQTTESTARCVGGGRFVIKKYDGEVSSVWRHPTAEAAQQAVEDDKKWLDRFRQNYVDVGLEPPGRNWEWEVV
jgi:hypothetical protein